MKRNKKKPTRRGNFMTFNDKKNQIETSIRRYQLRLFFVITNIINKQLEKKMTKSYGSIYYDNSFLLLSCPPLN